MYVFFDYLFYVIFFLSSSYVCLKCTVPEAGCVLMVPDHAAMNDASVEKPEKPVEARPVSSVRRAPGVADDATEIVIWFIQYVMKSRFVRQSEPLMEWVWSAFHDIFARGFFSLSFHSSLFF